MNQRKHGAVLGYVSIGVNIVIALALTPYMVRKLGTAEYGLFSIVGSLAAYLMIMDLGLNDSIVRFLARYRALGEHDREKTLLATAVVIYGTICAFVVAAAAVIYRFLPDLFGRTMTAEQIVSVRIMFIILVVNVVFMLLFNTISASIFAQERFVFLRTVEIFSSILMAASIALVLMYGFRAISVVFVMACINVFSTIVKIFYAFKFLKIGFSFSTIKLKEFKRIFQFSISIFAVVIVEKIYWKLDNIIIGALLGPSFVAVYAIGLAFNKYFARFATSISRVMYPKIIREVDQGATQDQLTNLLVRISRVQLILLALILLGLVIFGDEFISLWVGDEFRMAYFVMIVTLIPYGLELTGNVRNIVMQARDIYWYRAVLGLAIALGNVILTIVFVRVWGVVGAAASTAIGLLASYFGVSIILSRKLGLPMGRYFRGVWQGILPGVALAAVAGVGIDYVIASGNWFVFIAKTTVFTGMYSIIIWVMAMNKDEKRLILSLIPR